MQIDIISIFPDYLASLDISLVGKARRQGLVQINIHDLRQWADDPHRSVDDTPYGGGGGMVMRPEPWGRALDALVPTSSALPLMVVPAPTGRSFDQALAAEYATMPRLLFVCGRYEGIDYRVIEYAASRLRVDEVSIGDYVLAGGEVAALVMCEAVIRLLPGVVGNAQSVMDDSFATGLLEGPVYTRPEEWRGHTVPEVLRSGDHAAIARWRRNQALVRTAARRPDLITKMESELDAADRAALAE